MARSPAARRVRLDGVEVNRMSVWLTYTIKDKRAYTKPRLGTRNVERMIDALIRKYEAFDPKRYDADEQELKCDYLTH